MTDRELLELAAKAAGIKAYAMPGAMSCLWLESSMVNTMPTAWRPLTNDGDALRLAMKMGIQIHFEGSGDDDAVWANEIMLWTDGDVRAAAEIAGRNNQVA